jgi:hypothetical protein
VRAPSPSPPDRRGSRSKTARCRTTSIGNAIDFFGKGDILDLSGLHIDAGATATYNAASHHLAVHSGSVTDTLTLLDPLRTHFAVATDHHSGTDVFLFHA